MNYDQQLEQLKADNLFRERLTRTSQVGRYVSVSYTHLTLLTIYPV